MKPYYKSAVRSLRDEWVPGRFKMNQMTLAFAFTRLFSKMLNCLLLGLQLVNFYPVQVRIFCVPTSFKGNFVTSCSFSSADSSSRNIIAKIFLYFHNHLIVDIFSGGDFYGCKVTLDASAHSFMNHATFLDIQCKPYLKFLILLLWLDSTID